MKNKIAGLINEDIRVKRKLIDGQLDNIEALAKLMRATIKKGNKILVFGNGGSAADSLHIAAELVGRFRRERKGLPAVALCSNVSSLTALGNDYSFDYIFERHVEALGRKGDLALGISTSGNSENVIRGITKASKLKMKTAVLTGEKGGKLSRLADVAVKIPSNNTPRIQEAHITVAHIVCEIIEDAL